MPSNSELIGQLKALTANPPQDDAERLELFSALRDATFAVESGTDAFCRMFYGPISLSVAKAAGDMKLYTLLSEAQRPMTVYELSKASGAAVLLLQRVLRFLGSQNLVREVGPDQFEANAVTRALSDPGLKAGLDSCHHVNVPVWAAFPDYLAQKGYQNITNAKDTPFQKAFNTDLLPFQWGMERPARAQEFQMYMSSFRKDEPAFVDALPERYVLAEGSSPLLVDIGGGVGHQCALLKQKYPQITRSLVLQDLPHAVAHVVSGVEGQVYDFFTPQPVKGAVMYYLRTVLHDWSDEDCKRILSAQKDAMGEQSVILIDEMVLPERGVSWKSAYLDMVMMGNFAAIERTESQWRSLLHGAGLRLEEIHVYEPVTQSAVMVVKKE